MACIQYVRPHARVSKHESILAELLAMSEGMEL